MTGEYLHAHGLAIEALPVSQAVALFTHRLDAAEDTDDNPEITL